MPGKYPTRRPTITKRLTYLERQDIFRYVTQQPFT